MATKKQDTVDVTIYIGVDAEGHSIASDEECAVYDWLDDRRVPSMGGETVPAQVRRLVVTVPKPGTEDDDAYYVTLED